MQLFIYILALAALTYAKQLKTGPQILSEKPSSSEPSQKIDKRFVTQEFNLYLTPEEIKSLQAVKSPQSPAPTETLKQNSAISQESFNELIQKFYAENLKPAPIEEPQIEQAPTSSNFFLPKEESVYNNKQNFNFNAYRQLLIDQTKLSGQTQNVRQNRFNQLASPSVSNSDFVTNSPVLDRDQEEKLLHKQLNQQWTRILDHNRAQLKVLSSTPEKQQNYGSYTDQSASAFSKLASSSNRNEDQKKPAVDKEVEYVLRNGQIYQSRPLNSPTLVRTQNSGKNGGQKKSAVEKEIEDVWRQHQAFEFERSNSPAEVSKQIISVKNENQEKSEVEKQIEYILTNGPAYGFERSNAPAEDNKQRSQGRNEAQNESEVEKEIENFWRKQQESQFQKSYIPAGLFNQGPSGNSENKGKSEVDKQIENILRQQAFGFERSQSPADVIQSPSGKNENQEKSELEKQIEYILRNRQAEFERENAPEVKNLRPSVTNTDQNKSDVEKEIQKILKKHQGIELQRSKSTAEAISQSAPILIHKHVTITKHLPVPVLKNVQVSVPTPVLVPIPQPYEVKVPHLYPVPLEVVKHVPVPVVRNY